jgi:hypothetical protein
LVAEAPPAAPDRYFYFPAVNTQDSLFRYVVRTVLHREPHRESKGDDLEALRRAPWSMLALRFRDLDDSTSSRKA